MKPIENQLRDVTLRDALRKLNDEARRLYNSNKARYPGDAPDLFHVKQRVEAESSAR